MSISHLIVMLGDQLSHDMSSLEGMDKATSLVVMAEVHTEASYVGHHKKKIAYIFSAMRHHAKALEDMGWNVAYTRYDDAHNTGDLVGEVKRLAAKHQPDHIVLTEPGEWRLLQAFKALAEDLSCDLEIRPDTRFVCSHTEFRSWAKGRKQLRMEYFYREMRRKTGLLMAGSEPEGGQWNFDQENRKPASDSLFMPQPFKVSPDTTTREVFDLVEARFADNFGDLQPFWYAVTREDALKALDHFIEEALPLFGDYQDAMLTDEPFLYHSLLAQYLNSGLLSPLEICRKAEHAYHEGHAPLNCVEGFIRQIIGWREYIRGIYWLKMPDYVNENALDANRNLPWFYWTAETDLHCLSQAIAQTKHHAYAHHIQRLMITGNFAMLVGVEPKQIHEWYLAVYADAYEWVELPNTLGMSQFADGGLLASKPYAASGNYIKKMSNYCDSCRYSVNKKTGPDACPFNSLYWHFLQRNADTLRQNPRLAQVYRTWARMAPEKQKDYLQTAEAFLATLQD